MVSFGRSSSTQCPVSFRVNVCTFVATKCICGISVAALAWSPAIASTGIASFVFANTARSFAVCGQLAK